MAILACSFGYFMVAGMTYALVMHLMGDEDENILGALITGILWPMSLSAMVGCGVFIVLRKLWRNL